MINGIERVGKAYLPKKDVRLTLNITQSKQAAASQSQKVKVKLKNVPNPIPNKSELKLYRPDLTSSLQKPKALTKINEAITAINPESPALKLNRETANNIAPKILFFEKNKMA